MPAPRIIIFFMMIVPPDRLCVLSESFLHLIVWLIFRQSHPNFINVRTAYALKIWAQLTKNLLTKSSTKRFREYIYDDIVFVIYSLFIHYLFVI